MKHWNGLMKILRIEQVRNGEVIWSKDNVKNLLHSGGDQFILQILFGGIPVPSTWYLGLDNRSVINVADTIASLVSEPNTNGYIRQGVASDSFLVQQNNTAVWAATSPIVSFSAAGSSWGPIQNLFLTNQLGNAGVLIATAALGQAIVVLAGDDVRMRMALQLQDNTPST